MEKEGRGRNGKEYEIESKRKGERNGRDGRGKDLIRGDIGWRGERGKEGKRKEATEICI